MGIVVMGVCGSGKSTVGSLLAEKLNCPFLDADDYHPQSNVDKMARGEPLNDDDRRPWLVRLNNELAKYSAAGKQAVLACSALKGVYRDILSEGMDDLHFVYLKGDYEIIYKRMTQREGHFMGKNMLTSQFDTLEEPDNAIVVDIADCPEVIVSNIESQIEKI